MHQCDAPRAETEHGNRMDCEGGRVPAGTPKHTGQVSERLTNARVEVKPWGNRESREPEVKRRAC
jgi:hypothetical protein